MTADECESRLIEMDRRHTKGVRLFPDDYDCLRYLAGLGVAYLRQQEAVARDAALTLAKIPRAEERP